MGFRSKLPLFLSAVLLVGIVMLAWLKLRRWQGVVQPVGILACATYIGWILLEGRTAVRDSRAKSVRSDRGTMELYAMSQGATVFTALLIESHWPIPGHVCPIVGALVLAMGVALRTSAVRTLGAFYSHRVQVGPSHRIVDCGPYRWVRHPAYSGMLCIHLGFVLVFFNWFSLGLVAFAILPAVVRRITVEERALSDVTGYPEFCRERARLIPLVW